MKMDAEDYSFDGKGSLFSLQDESHSGQSGGMPMNLDTSFPSIFTLHSSFFIVFRIVLLVSQLQLQSLICVIWRSYGRWSREQGRFRTKWNNFP